MCSNLLEQREGGLSGREGVSYVTWSVGQCVGCVVKLESLVNKRRGADARASSGFVHKYEIYLF